MQLLPLIVIFILGYLLLVRPQQQRARRQRDLVSALEVGTEVQTAGGILGRIVGLDDQVVRIEVSPGVVISFVRGAVARVIDTTAPDEDDENEVDGAEGDRADDDAGDHPGPGTPGGDHPGHDQGPEAEAG